MKKLFIVLAVVSLGFVACNNSGEKKETTDSPAVETPATVDTPATPAVDTTKPAAADTTAPAK